MSHTGAHESYGEEFVDLQAMLSGSGSEAYAIQIGQRDGARIGGARDLSVPLWLSFTRFQARSKYQEI